MNVSCRTSLINVNGKFEGVMLSQYTGLYSVRIKRLPDEDQADIPNTFWSGYVPAQYDRVELALENGSWLTVSRHRAYSYFNCHYTIPLSRIF